MIAIKYLHVPSERVARFLTKTNLVRLLPVRGRPSLVVRTIRDVEFYDKGNGALRRYPAGEHFISFENCLRSRLFGLLWDPNDAVDALAAKHPGEWHPFGLYFEYLSGYLPGDADYLAFMAENDAEHHAAWLARKEEAARWEPDRIDRTVAEMSAEELRRHVREFEVVAPYESSEGKAEIITVQCQLGGCAMESVEFDSYHDALAEAAKREHRGEGPAWGVCPECAAEYW